MYEWRKCSNSPEEEVDELAGEAQVFHGLLGHLAHRPQHTIPTLHARPTVTHTRIHLIILSIICFMHMLRSYDYQLIETTEII